MTAKKLLLSVAAGGLVVAAVAVPTALAATSSSKSGAKPPATAGKGSTQPCPSPYPGKRTPSLTLTATPSTFTRGTAMTPSGNGTGNGCAIGLQRMGLYSSPTLTGTFTVVTSTTSDAAGKYTFTRQKPEKSTYYKVVFAGSSEWDPAMSPVVKATVK